MSGSATWLLAAISVDLPKNNKSMGKLPSLLLSDVFLILGLGLGLLLILAAIVYLWMKLRRNRRRHVSGGEKVYRGSARHESDAADDHDSGRDHSDVSEDDDEGDGDSDHSHHHHGRRRYKYRVRRRSHRSRNPTLSEAGGLPPVKSQSPEGKPF